MLTVQPCWQQGRQRRKPGDVYRCARMLIHVFMSPQWCKVVICIIHHNLCCIASIGPPCMWPGA